MPVNEKILFRSFQYLFSLKSIIYAIFVVGNAARKSRCFLGKKYRFPRGGEINIRFRSKYRPLKLYYSINSSIIVTGTCTVFSRYFSLVIFVKFTHIRVLMTLATFEKGIIFLAKFSTNSNFLA
jgi:hypothetical protein